MCFFFGFQQLRRNNNCINIHFFLFRFEFRICFASLSEIFLVFLRERCCDCFILFDHGCESSPEFLVTGATEIIRFFESNIFLFLMRIKKKWPIRARWKTKNRANPKQSILFQSHSTLCDDKRGRSIRRVATRLPAQYYVLHTTRTFCKGK